MDPLRAARIDLAAALRWAERLGLHEGVCNHFSVRAPGAAERFLVNPFGVHWSRITAGRLLLLDRDGRVVEGEGKVENTAFCIHAAIHRRDPRAACVLHTHMPWATALAVAEGGRLEPASQNALRFHGDVSYDDAYNGLALDQSEGERIAAALGGKRVLFLASHGVIVTGASVAQAFDDLYYLERACQVQVLAESTGRTLRRIPEEVARRTFEEFASTDSYARSHFDALKGILAQDAPDYAS